MMGKGKGTCRKLPIKDGVEESPLREKRNVRFGDATWGGGWKAVKIFLIEKGVLKYMGGSEPGKRSFANGPRKSKK